MKKLLALVLSLMLLFSLCAVTAADDSDLAYVTGKGTLVIGITDFEPMDYLSDTGEWIGFDADTAKAFCAYLGVEPEFVVIDWDSKTMELDSRNIDCVWNGMTITDGVKKAMQVSSPYCLNGQVVVVKAQNAAGVSGEEAISGFVFAVEAGSSGEEVALERGWEIVSVQSQGDALLEVAAGTCDACIIDLLMAAAMVGEGTNYAGLTYTLLLNEEEYGVGFRTGSDLAAALDAYLDEAYRDGSLIACAEQYGIGASLIAR